MKRKRSAYVGFSLMTVSAALIGCERPEPEPPVRPGPTQAAGEAAETAFASVEECAARMNRTDCEAAFQQARSEHDGTAPRFTSQADCEQQWGVGNCENRPDQVHAGGGSIFMPILAGFLIGRAFSGGGMFGAPLSRRGDRYYSRGGPVAVGGGFGRSTVRSAPGPVQRGGFGQTSSYRGAGG